MSTQGCGFGGYAFLETAIASQANDLMIENLVFGSIEMSGRHLRCNGHAHGIANPLTKGAGGAFDSGGFAEFRMPGSLAVQLAEILYFLDRKIVTGKMKPTVKKHAPVTSRQNETVTIDPLGIGWIDLKILTEQDGPDFGCTEGKSEVPRTACVNGIDGQASGLVCGLLENFLVLHSGGEWDEG